MVRLTGAWLGVLAVLLVAPACGGGAITGPSNPFEFKNCELPTYGAMTATLDGTSWVPVMTRARAGVSYVGLEASDCTYSVMIDIKGFRGLGTYEVAQGEVSVDLGCDGTPCGWRWIAGDVGRFAPDIRGSGSVMVTSYTARTQDDGSGKIEGTFSFTLVPNLTGATGTRVIANGRFGSAFTGFY